MAHETIGAETVRADGPSTRSRIHQSRPGDAPSRVHGRLRLVFALRGRDTILADAHVAAPLKIVRPFSLDRGRTLVQILTLGPGLCAGDHCDIDVTVEPGAQAVVIMQSASRVLGMPEGEHATQSVHLTVGAGGQLEYYPGLTIPFPDSSVVQRVHARAEAGSRLGLLESWATGRSRRGEYLRFRRISSRTTVAIDGTLAYADAIELEPSAVDVAGAGILEGYRYVASGFWYGAAREAVITPAFDGVLMAFGQAAPGQVYLRALAMDGCAIAEALQSAIRRINAGWGLEPPQMRRFTA